MNSIGEECTDLKKQYDDCFNSWFSERFLKGDHDDSVCAGIFKVYQDCVKKAMKQQNIDFKEIEKDVLGTENEFKVPPSENNSS
ncbi:TP53-regulated inhibitor of apoptosis 1-like [Epargyreus clarus]|uniref:TP53-regulated inhibitor of apoptosis 1-like n=1 Tax=Epargyreus clarus TaxID=520877 RepID=UPI003C2F6E46